MPIKSFMLKNQLTAKFDVLLYDTSVTLEIKQTDGR